MTNLNEIFYVKKIIVIIIIIIIIIKEIRTKELNFVLLS